MRKSYVSSAYALLVFTIILFGNTVSAQAGPSYAAKILLLDGYVDVKYSGTDTFVILPPWETLGTGDVIETGKAGKIVLKLPDGSKLVIGENSRIVIKELGEVEVTKAPKNTFELVRGKIRAIVKPFVSRDSVFNIETNNTTAGVRGTDFGVTYDPDVDTTYVLGMTGTLWLSLKKFPKIHPVTIEGGHAIFITGSNRPGAPYEAKKEAIDGFLKGMEVKGEGGIGEFNPGRGNDHGNKGHDREKR
jgi:hypothetical protein